MASLFPMQIRSEIPGRVRWRVPAVVGQPRLAAAVTHALAEQPGIDEVVANPTTGGLLLRFQPDLPLSEVQSWVEQAIARALAALDDFSFLPGNSASSTRALRRGSRASSTNTNGAALDATRADTQAPLMRLLDRTRQHRNLVMVTTGTSIVNRLFEGAPPVMIGTAVDIVTRGPRSVLAFLGFKTIGSQLLALGGLGLVVWTIDAAMGYAQQVLSAKLANTVRHDLRLELYDHVQQLDISQIESQNVTQWMAVLDDDVNQVYRFIEEGTDPIVTILANGAIVATTFVMLAPKLALAQLLLVPPLLLASTKLLGPIKTRFKQARGEARQLQALLHDNIAGMATIASFRGQELEARRVAEASARHMQRALQASEMSAVYVPTLQMIVGGGFITTLVWGGALVSRGQLPAGAYNVMGFSELRLMVALGRLGVSLENYQRTNVALERIFNVLDLKPRITSGTRPLPRREGGHDVAFERVVFGYDADRPVLKGLELEFPAGHTTGIVGASGAGKSTVLKLLLRFYDVQTGAVRVDGIDVRELRLDDLRGAIAMVPQEITLFAGTVRENIAYGRPDATLDEVVAAARMAEAHKFIEALPEGYDTRLSHGGHTLSVGQRQRLAIARVILADRPILLFDEATSALDHETEASVQRSLAEVTVDRTTIIVAHRLSTVRHADRIYVLDDGQVREQGRHDELLAADGIYASMWRVQTGEAAPRRTGQAARTARRETPPKADTSKPVSQKEAPPKEAPPKGAAPKKSTPKKSTKKRRE